VSACVWVCVRVSVYKCVSLWVCICVDVWVSEWVSEWLCVCVWEKNIFIMCCDVIGSSSIEELLRNSYNLMYSNVARYLNRYSDWLRDGRSRDLIPMGARFFAHVQTDPGSHPAYWTMDTGSFPGVKRPGRGANHPPPSSAEVENELIFTSTPPLGQEACYRVNFTLMYSGVPWVLYNRT
jgi:hypothetical protein